MSENIYKIATRADWTAAQSQGSYAGSDVDQRDGFIHFSTRSQVRETAKLHFAGQVDLVLVEVDPLMLGNDLKWEPSRGGELFPHLYSELKMAGVKSVVELPLVGGNHVFGDNF
jgi:uncharacterized protein (DUF952 family)